MPPDKLLFVSTPVGPLGTGRGGGVELTLLNAAKALIARGHSVEIIAPEGSVMALCKVKEIAGSFQIPCQEQCRTDPITIPANSNLAKMWHYAYQVQGNYDLILNFSYDWLPLYLTPFFGCPIAHLISMSSLTDAMDQIIEQVATQFPGTVGVHSRTQAATFSFGEQLQCVFNGIDLSIYQFCEHPRAMLAWAGRVAPEKGLEDAVAAATLTGIPLKIFGLMQNKDYWQGICRDYPDAPIEYRGFLPTVQLQQELGQCRALLVTPRWIEAYGNVAVEALACGVPLIAYNRGGLSEIVQPGKTGWLVEPDSVAGLVQAISCLGEINRFRCRQQAETEYSLNAFGERLEHWFDIIKKHRKNSEAW